MVQGADCSFNDVTQQGIAHFATDLTHPLDLLLHVFRFYATSFQMDSMTVRNDDDDDDDDDDDLCDFVFRLTVTFQVALEKHQSSRGAGAGCLSVLHM